MVFSSLRGPALVALLAALPLACVAADERTPTKPSASRTPDVENEGVVAHRDRRLDAPSFVWLNRADTPFATTAAEAAHDALPDVVRAFGIATDATIEMRGIDDSGRGPIVARYAQRVHDLEVFRGGVNVLMTRGLRPIAASGFLAPSTRGSDRAFGLTALDAVAVGARLVGTRPTTFAPAEARNGYERFAAPGLLAPARVKRVLMPVRDAAGPGPMLEPAFYVEVQTKAGAARAWILSAIDGRVLLENDLVRSDAFTYRVYADAATMLPMDGPQGNGLAPHPTGMPDKRKLEWLPSQSVTLQNVPFSKNDPWLAPGSTTTNGNNVWAYADLATPDGFIAGTDLEPTASPPGTFGQIYDTSAAPNATPASIEAATTQLFYVTNFLHDWYYDAGFDEKSGNHQYENFERGGKSGDPLYAEAQDFSGRNNANALVPPDGQSPRIQMFVFSGASEASLEVTAPAPIAGVKKVGIASGFGKDAFDLPGPVVLAVDGAGADPADGCEPLDALAGKIVLIHRGTCSFAQKAQNAAAAGAIGAIIANVATSTNAAIAPFMGGTQGGITIPVLSLNVADGAALEGAIASGVTVTMKRSLTSALDGALDTTIVAHEWGHVLSSRLVGDGMGLTTNQAGGLGEGWGDFTALVLMARADDPGQFGGTYANGSYATSGSGDDVYFGTRRLPYSIDFTKNALTLKHIANGTPLPSTVATSFGEDGSFNAEVHNTGEVWATMLWECYASLLREGRLPFAEAQDRMKRYLVASLKLTPSDPTILEARDAMLAAAFAGDPLDFQTFWKAFARRGAGAGAVGPDKESTNNQGVIESFDAGNAVAITEVKVLDDVISCDHDGILDEAEVGTVEVTVRNAGSGTLDAAKAELVSKTEGVTLLETAPVVLAPLKPFESAKARLRVRLKGTTPTQAVAIELVVSEPSLPEARVARVMVPARYDADQAPESSAIDHVDTTRTAWKVAGEGAGEKWARSTTTGDGFWSVVNPPRTADHQLTSPAFTVETASFTLAFKHKWSFKRSNRRNVDIDGGLIELSLDRGKTWKDLSTYGVVDYNTKVDDTGGVGDNPLKGRKSYGGKSPGFPDAWVTSRIDVTLPDVPESVQLRFRMGAASGFVGADGWAIDDVELIGAGSTPFWSYIAHTDSCDPNGPTVDAGPPQAVGARTLVKLAATSAHPTNLPLTLLWEQVAGPPVVLKDEGTLTPTFDAPDTKEPITITLALRAHDGTLLSPVSRVDVLVNPAGAPAADGCGCRTTTSRASEPMLGALVGLGMLLLRRGRRKIA